MTKTIAVYTRTNAKSTDKPFSGSFPKQMQQCIARAKLLYCGEMPSVRIYHDECIDALGTNRPALQSMIRDIEQGRVDAVFVSDTTRFSRIDHDVANLTALFKKHNVELVVSME